MAVVHLKPKVPGNSGSLDWNRGTVVSLLSDSPLGGELGDNWGGKKWPRATGGESSLNKAVRFRIFGK